MSGIFSAYAQPQWEWGKLLKRAALLLLALLGCRWLLSAVPIVDAPLVMIAGVLLWLLGMIGAYLLPNRVTFGFAVLGALVVGTGILTTAYGNACYCESSDSLLPGLRRALSGEPEPPQFTLICL